MNEKKLTIGLVAKLTGVNLETIRYYQRIGLIDEPEKPRAGYRIYPETSINRIHFIQRAKALGFSLAEILRLLELENAECEQTRELAQQKLQLINSKIRQLQTLAAVLAEHIDACKSNSDRHTCPIIAALSDN